LHRNLLVHPAEKILLPHPLNIGGDYPPNEMRTARPHTFNYTDPRCVNCSAFMTSEEKYMMDMLCHLRKNAGAKAHLSAMLLCEGNDPTALLAAGSNLVAVINEHCLADVLKAQLH
ncbi:hypothetical protein ACGYLD_12105, partial [Sulfitobacter sp. 1A12056]